MGLKVDNGRITRPFEAEILLRDHLAPESERRRCPDSGHSADD